MCFFKRSNRKGLLGSALLNGGDEKAISPTAYKYCWGDVQCRGPTLFTSVPICKRLDINTQQDNVVPVSQAENFF